MEPEQRAGAVISASEETKIVEFAGYGVYKGDEVPPKGIEFMGMDLHEMNHTNPRIDLDNGHTVWGCQCWWGSEKAIEDKMKAYLLNGYELSTVDPSVYSLVD